MKYREYTRANNFDRRCGYYQTLKTIELGRGESILDIGCGVGEFTPLFLWRFKEVVGLDPDAQFLREARNAPWRIRYIKGWGETFESDEKFDTISMNNLLEHVDDPVALLKNCKKHLSDEGVIIAQVPNAESITRRLGVLMGVIDSLTNITKREKNFFGHQRTYFLNELEEDVKRAGLRIVSSGGLIYKPLPNEFLEELCKKNGEEWADRFLSALNRFGEERPRECAYLYICAE